MCDTLELLRPKLKISTSWDEASQAADALDKEFASKLGEFSLVKLRRVEFLLELRLKAKGYCLSYEITQCYLPPNTSEHTLS